MSLTDGHDLAELHAHRLAERDRERTPADYLVAVPDEAGSPEVGWRIDDDRAAAYALRRIAEEEAEVARLRAAAEADIAAVREWLADAVRPHDGTITHYTGALIDYRHRLEDENPKLPKTYKLPGGDLTRRAGRISIVVADEDALLAWAESNAPAVISRKALVTPLKGDGFEVVIDRDEPVGRVVTSDGEVVPGVEVPAPADTYSVKVRAEISPVERAS